jgi:hypothetical protein
MRPMQVTNDSVRASFTIGNTNCYTASAAYNIGICAAYRCYTTPDTAVLASRRAEDGERMTTVTKNMLGLLSRKKVLTERQEALPEIGTVDSSV